MNEIKFLIVDKENEGRRLDNILLVYLEIFPNQKYTVPSEKQR